jgi:mRNA interferase YafQ
MRRQLRRTSQFKRDVKRQVKRGKNPAVLKKVITLLVDGAEMADTYHDHPLVGGYRGSRECHLEPDWLLIYELTEDELILIRTGSHADLFE